MDKTLILLEDLHCTMQYMYRGTATISFYTNESNANIWEIRGPKKNLVVMLHYQNDCTETDDISGSGDTIFIKEEPTDVEYKCHQNECCSDINCTDAASAAVHKNRLSDDDLTCPMIDYASQSTICNSTSNEKAVPVQLNTCNNVSNDEAISHLNTYIKSSADTDVVADKKSTSVVSDLTCHLINDYTLQSTRYNIMANEEAVPVLDMVCSINKNVSGEFVYSQIFKSESKHEIKANYGHSCHSNCESVIENSINLGVTPFWNKGQDSQKPLNLRDCKTYFSLHDAIPIIEEDAVEAKMLQLLQNTGIEQEPENEFKIVPVCDSNISHLEDIVGKTGKMIKLKDCIVLLEPLDITNLKISHLPAALEPDTYSITDQVVRDGRNNVECTDNLFYCSSSEKKLQSKYSMIKQKFIHNRKKAFKCLHCSKKFSSKQTLKNHKLTHTGLKSYKCFQCNMKFTQKPNLVRHELIHAGVKPYECSQCNKKFNRKSHLEEHKLTHSGVKPHECSQCHKKFTQKQDLVRHELIHSGEKPYECSECKKKFTQQQNLLRHKLIHSGVKPHECSQCDKKFSEKRDLLRHELIHSEVKPHECSQCNKKFKLKQHLVRHKLTHSKVSCYKC